MKSFLFSLGLLSFLFITACDGPKKPEFTKMENVKFRSVIFAGTPSVSLTGDAVFNNPNAIGATVTEVDLDVYINDKMATHVHQNMSVEVPANSAFRLPLEMDISLAKLMQDGKSQMDLILKSKKLQYKLVGDIKIGLGSVEFKVPVEYADEKAVSLR